MRRKRKCVLWLLPYLISGYEGRQGLKETVGRDRYIHTDREKETEKGREMSRFLFF